MRKAKRDEHLFPFLARLLTQPLGLAQARHSQPCGQHRRTLDVARRLWLRPGRLGGRCDLRRRQSALHLVLGQRLYLHERHERRHV